MKKYYIDKNAQPTGVHVIHIYDNCPTPADPENRVDLGSHALCLTAIRKAKQYYDEVDGCKNCIPKCHTE